MKHLKGLTELRILHLMGTGIDDTALAQIRQYIARHTGCRLTDGKLIHPNIRPST